MIFAEYFVAFKREICIIWWNWNIHGLRKRFMKENFEHDTKDKHIHVVPILFVCVPVNYQVQGIILQLAASHLLIVQINCEARRNHGLTML